MSLKNGSEWGRPIIEYLQAVVGGPEVPGLPGNSGLQVTLGKTRGGKVHTRIGSNGCTTMNRLRDYPKLSLEPLKG